MCSPILECKSGSCNEVADCLRHKHFARCCKPGNPSPDVGSNAGEIFAYQFAFASVNATAQLKPKRVHGIVDRLAGSYCSGRTVESHQKAASCCADFASAIMLQHVPDTAVEFIQYFTPSIVSHGRNLLG